MLKRLSLVVRSCCCGARAGDYHAPRCPSMIAGRIQIREPYCVECGFYARRGHFVRMNGTIVCPVYS